MRLISTCILLHPIDGQKRKASEYQLARSWLATRTASARKRHEGAYVFIDAERYTPRGFRAVMFIGEITNSGKVAGGWIGPADTHQPV